MSPVHPDQASDQFRNEFGIPLARPGTAMESAQSVISVMVVSRQYGHDAYCELNLSAIYQNKYQTGSEVIVDGGWLLEMAF